MSKEMISRLVGISVFSIVLIYLGKPDRGGLSRCSRVFSIPEIQQLELTQSRFMTWDFFESAKFRFKIDRQEFTRISAILAEEGYSEWKKGSLHYGSVFIGGSEDDDFIYCSKYGSGLTRHWSYSEKEGVIYAISFPN